MVRRDISAGAMPTGLHITMLLACAGFLGIVCIVNFYLRWTLWCNISDAPMLDACINIALTMASSVTAALACSGMMRPEHLRRVVLMYGLFFVTLPTIMFFRDYLTANMLVVLSMYNIMHLHRQGMEKGHIFFASFFVVIALWFVPSAAVFILPVYLGILIFTPGDIRSWFIPLAGAGASYILMITYDFVFLGGSDFLPDISFKLFSMPYTEKVFKAENFYFYAVGLALALAYAYIKYWNTAQSDTVPQKKMFLTVSSMLAAATLTAVLLPQYRYLTIFFSMPFAVVTTEFFAGSGGGKGIIRWYLIILAGFSLFFFK